MFSKVSKAKKWLIGIGAGCLSVSMCATGCVLGLRNNANAITNNDTTSYVKVGEIWNGTEFNKENFTKLVQYVSGNANASAKDLSSVTNTTKTSAQIKTNAVGDKTSGKDIIVTFGGLDWEVVYLSPDKSSNPTLTLWLSNNTQSAFSGRSQTEGAYHGYVDGALYSDWSGDWYSTTRTLPYPSSMYGTSYVRAVTLNNGGMYTYGNGSTTTPSTTTASKNSSSAFAKFTMDSVSGNVTQFLTTPNQMSWQQDQSDRAVLGFSYDAPNEALAPTNANWYTDMNFTDRTGYTSWGSDYLWLPSLTETGNSDTKIGIWNTSLAQRQNYDGSTTSITLSSALGSSNASFATTADTYSWLRSGHASNVDLASGLNPSGSSSSSSSIYASRAVRPALHLNLKKAADTITYTWQDFAADQIAEGDGTEASPWKIGTAEELAWLIDGLEDGKTYYVELKANIDLGAYNWMPIRNTTNGYTVYFDGKNHTISNLTIDNNTDKYIGFFYGYKTSVFASNIIFDNVDVYTHHAKCAGVLAGNFAADFGAENIIVSSGKVVGVGYTGGIIGQVSSTGITSACIGIINCINNATITAWGYHAGGICGQAFGIRIMGCMNFGNVSGGRYVGGIVGNAYANVVNCYAECSITSYVTDFDNNTGGVCGYTLGDGELVNCGFYGDIIIMSSSPSYVGAVCGGCEDSKIANSFAIANIYLRTASDFSGVSQEGIWIVEGCSAEIIDCYSYSCVYIETGKAEYKKFVNSSNFENFAYDANLNHGYPFPKDLFAVGQFMDSEGVLEYLQSKGFKA